MKKEPLFFFSLIVVAINLSCSPPNNVSKAGSKKRFFVQPVYLSVKGIEKDTAIRQMFEEAFAKYKVQLITHDEMTARNENEMKRAQQKLLLKKDELKQKSAEDVMKAMIDEIKYVSNMLSINLDLQDKDDSLMIYKAWWSNIPLPPNLSHGYITKKKEINLANLSYSIKENIYSIVDSILYANELK